MCNMDMPRTWLDFGFFDVPFLPPIITITNHHPDKIDECLVPLSSFHYPILQIKSLRYYWKWNSHNS